MTSLRESWKRTEAHLRRAHQSAGSPTLADCHDYLDHNELELAADVLADFGDEREDLEQQFWEGPREDPTQRIRVVRSRPRVSWAM